MRSPGISSSTARSGCAIAGPSLARESLMDDSARPTAPTAAEAEVPELPDQHTALPPSPARREAGPTRPLIARRPPPGQGGAGVRGGAATLGLVGQLRPPA